MMGRGARMTVPQNDHRDPSRSGAADSDVSQADVELAVRRYVHFILSARCKRRKYLGERLFAEPAWDILLHLYAAELEDEQSLSLEGLAGVVQIPASTVLRWVHALEADGLIASNALPADPSQTFVNLSETGRAALGSYFRDIAAAAPPP
jgi:DNA-binding MarR family transcriptional regulator